MTRFDSVGLWWEDFPQPARGRQGVRRTQNIPPPPTNWAPPKEFPNLSEAKVIGLDTETKDLELLTRGPGAVRGAAHAVGVSVAVEDASWYFPLRHEYAAQIAFNMNPEPVFRWLQDTLCSRPVPVVGANLLYDLEVLRAEGVPLPAGELFDVQYAEPLLDEEAFSYSLDTLAQKHLGRGKETPQLYEWCAASFGGEADGKQRANIWRAPPSLVGPYAEADARLPLQILAQQRRLLHEQQLTDLFRVECGLIPLLLDMRFRGVPIDTTRVDEVSAWLVEKAAEAQERIPGVDVWSADSIAHAFDAAGLSYPRTEAGNPSFTKEFLESVVHPLAQSVHAVRMYEKARNPFVDGYLRSNLHNGRVHCQFNPLRSDAYGTVSGRFSSSNPNLQNIPSRDKVIGPMLRGLFVPEEGCVWRRQDYSQIEYRLLAHYAVGPGAEEIRERYRTDPRTDFHEMTVNLVQTETGVLLDRKPAKNLNFGLVYGMSRDKTTRSLGVSEDLGDRLYEAYHSAMPSVKKTYRAAERLAKNRGYIRTILNRRRRFKNAEYTHKALNSILQGGAADVMKRAMYDIYRAGLTKVLGPPHLTVHDELDWSDPQTKESKEAFEEVERIMVTCIPLRIPLMIDVSTGRNWGECK